MANWVHNLPYLYHNWVDSRSQLKAALLEHENTGIVDARSCREKGAFHQCISQHTHTYMHTHQHKMLLLLVFWSLGFGSWDGRTHKGHDKNQKEIQRKHQNCPKNTKIPKYLIRWMRAHMCIISAVFISKVVPQLVCNKVYYFSCQKLCTSWSYPKVFLDYALELLTGGHHKVVSSLISSGPQYKSLITISPG